MSANGHSPSWHLRTGDSVLAWVVLLRGATTAVAVLYVFKAEVIHRRSWRSLEQVKLATAEWVDWWNHRRLHSAIDDLPPAEYEARYHRQHEATQAA
jgi:transposase InsO family protein